VILTKVPAPQLRPFVSRLWATDVEGDAAHGAPAERVLPTGKTHLALRLGSEPLRILDDPTGAGAATLGWAVVGGVRASPYYKDVSRPVPSLGAVLEPGATSLLFDAPADALAGRHTPLDAIWGAEADRLREELAGIPALDRRLLAFERQLRGRLPDACGLHPGVAHALRRLGQAEPGAPDAQAGAVGRAAAESGLGHRRFGRLFRAAVGLSPKRWARLRRFQHALRRAAADSRASWADAALAAGYCDQPHLTREFREFTGLCPGDYRRLAGVSPDRANHVPLRPLGTPFSSRPSRPAS
jgi:AraC-like DNA-binding protein